jgi:hypothetical protein
VTVKSKTKKKALKQDRKATAINAVGLEKLQSAYKNGTTLRGVISGVTTQGFIVDVEGVTGYLPKTHFSTTGPRTATRYKGESITVKVIKLERQGLGRIYLSHDLVVVGNRKPLAPTRSPTYKREVRESGKKTIWKKQKVLRPGAVRCGLCLAEIYPATRSICIVCTKRLHAEDAPIIRSVVQGGSPGLSKKQTLKIGKTIKRKAKMRSHAR